MKWLLLSLLSINLILFIVNFKNQEKPVAVYQKADQASEIKLLSEESQAGSQLGRRCYVLGDIESEDQIARAKKFLSDEGVLFQLVNKEQDLASVFWVYVQRDDERQVKELLKKQGVDSYLITEGELRGMLSAGLFENIDLARALVKKIEALGAEANIFERKKQKNNISIEFASDQISDKAMLMKGFRDQGIIISEIKEFFCKGIASEK